MRRVNDESQVSLVRVRTFLQPRSVSVSVGQMSADCRTGGETVSSLVCFSGNGSVASTLV